MKYVPPVGGEPNDPYVDGNPATGTEGSPVPAAAIEHPMREIVAAIEGFGGTPSSESLTQLIDLILANLARITGSADQVFRVSEAVGDNDAVPLGQMPAVLAAAPGGNLRRITVFDSQGVTAYEKPVWLKFAVVEGDGGGGGGGGAAATGGSESSVAGAGGAGGWFRRLIPAASLSASETVTIGPGGAGGGAGANNGSAGGTTSFGAHCSATGGGGGMATIAASGARSRSGGVGGVGVGGDLVADGGAGSAGAQGDFGAIGSVGGTSYYSGGPGTSSTTGRNPGVNGKYGAGGSGASNTPSQTAAAGGDGGGGLVIVFEYE